MLWRKKKRKLHVRIIRNAQPWNEGDAASLATFLAGPTGEKLLAKLEYLIYNETISTDPMSDLKRGTIQGLILSVGGIRNMAMQHYTPIDQDPEEDDEDQEQQFQGLY